MQLIANYASANPQKEIMILTYNPGLKLCLNILFEISHSSKLGWAKENRNAINSLLDLIVILCQCV